MRTRRLYRRTETDTELLARVKQRSPHAYQLSCETVDQFAERFGLERRIVDDES